MSVTMRIDGGKESQAALANMAGEIRKAAGMAVAQTAAELEGVIELRIQQGPKTGRVYKRGNRMHRASAPGQAPASDFGILLGSIYHERETDLTYTVGSRMAEAAYLEYSTSRMAARPFFRPSVEEIRPVFQGRLEQLIKGATT